MAIINKNIFIKFNLFDFINYVSFFLFIITFTLNSKLNLQFANNNMDLLIQPHLITNIAHLISNIYLMTIIPHNSTKMDLLGVVGLTMFRNKFWVINRLGSSHQMINDQYRYDDQIIRSFICVILGFWYSEMVSRTTLKINIFLTSLFSTSSTNILQGRSHRDDAVYNIKHSQA